MERGLQSDRVEPICRRAPRCARSLAVFLCFTAAAATEAMPQPTLQPERRIGVFFDCQSGCDFDYIRTEMEFVDYVRNREDADVHILVTAQATGAGGREFTINFIGLRTFARFSDTLRYVSAQDATDDERRRGLLRVLQVGMMRFIGTTSLAARMQIEVAREAEEQEPGARGPGAQGRDRWDFWVFRVGLDGSLSGESRQASRDMSMDLSVNRTTERWKIDVGLDGNYDDERFEIEEEDTTTLTSVRRSYSLEVLVAKSLGAHLSAGLWGNLESSTFGNQQLAWTLAPAVEYNVFPYSESTRRIFTILYGVGMTAFAWREVTIFDRTRETRPLHALEASYATRQPWGSMNASADFSQYLHDTSKNRIEVSGGMEVRLFRGFSLEMDASYARVHDQLSIPARGASRDEILLRLRQLRTSYEYDLSLGISYRLGSIFNNVVNPRFR